MKLHGYFRSSAAYRVRIALNLKGIDCEQVPVNLLKGEQRSEPYLAKNPQGLVPLLETERGALAQSLAILEWLEQQYPQTPLLPADPWQAAQVRSLVYAVACDIHPLNNLRVLKYLADELQLGEGEKRAWYHHWLGQGFAGIEPRLAAAPYCCGEQVTLADVVLIPQLYNAKRFDCDLSAFPNIEAVDRACHQLPAFVDARPENQPDCPL